MAQKEGFVSPRSTLVGQPGSETPPGFHSLPGQFGEPNPSDSHFASRGIKPILARRLPEHMEFSLHTDSVHHGCMAVIFYLGDIDIE